VDPTVTGDTTLPVDELRIWELLSIGSGRLFYVKTTVANCSTSFCLRLLLQTKHSPVLQVQLVHHRQPALMPSAAPPS
jgi:hypothetical protein